MRGRLRARLRGRARLGGARLGRARLGAGLGAGLRRARLGRARPVRVVRLVGAEGAVRLLDGADGLGDVVVGARTGEVLGDVVLVGAVLLLLDGVGVVALGALEVLAGDVGGRDEEGKGLTDGVRGRAIDGTLLLHDLALILLALHAANKLVNKGL